MTAGRVATSKNKDWCTPPKYVKAVRKVFNDRICLDPCSGQHSLVKAEVEYKLPGKDGLAETWNYPTIYVNPPYGRVEGKRSTIYDWLKRCYDAHYDYGSQVLALVPVAVNTDHWKHFVFGGAAGVCFLYDTRLKFFENGREIEKGAPMACCMIYWGDNFESFFNVFNEHGAVIDLRPLYEVKGKRRIKQKKLLA